MLTSDWSADVCSSDLPQRGCGRRVGRLSRRQKLLPARQAVVAMAVSLAERGRSPDPAQAGPVAGRRGARSRAGPGRGVAVRDAPRLRHEPTQPTRGAAQPPADPRPSPTSTTSVLYTPHVGATPDTPVHHPPPPKA